MTKNLMTTMSIKSATVCATYCI